MAKLMCFRTLMAFDKIIIAIFKTLRHENTVWVIERLILQHCNLLDTRLSVGQKACRGSFDLFRQTRDNEAVTKMCF